MALLSKSAFLAKFIDSVTGLFRAGQNRGIGSDDVRDLTQDLTDSFIDVTTFGDRLTRGYNVVSVSDANTLRSIPTLSVQIGATISFRHTDGTQRMYVLQTSTVTDNGFTQIRPNDYNGATNTKVWVLASTYVLTDTNLGTDNSQAPSQLAVKTYVDNKLDNVSWKQICRVATTANITLSGEQTIDGILTSASRVLVKNQTTQSQNGIYVSAAGAWTRATDLDASSEFNGATVEILLGTQAGQRYRQETLNPTVGTTNIVWTLVGTNNTPSATETTEGKAEIATQTEVNTGTDDLRFVTPLKLETRYGAHLAQGYTNATPTTVAGLRTIPTVGVSVPKTIVFRNTNGQLYAYRLDAGTATDNGFSIIRPNDYAASTNEKVWSIAVPIALNENDFVSNSSTLPPTQASVAQYLITQLLGYQLNPILVTSNIVAANNRVYNCNATATFTDPTGVSGRGYVVSVRSGTATIGGIGYGVGSLVYRLFDGTTWASYPYELATNKGAVNGYPSLDGSGKIPIGQLPTIDNASVVVNSNITASNNSAYIVIANATFTDPTGVDGRGYEVFVRNGNATVGGIVYPVAGTIIRRIFNSGSWQNYTVARPSGTMLRRLPVNVTVTGTTSETIMDSFLIPAGTIRPYDMLYWESVFLRTNSNNTMNIRFRVNTTNTIGGTTIAQFAFLNTQFFLKFSRTLYINSAVNQNFIINNNALNLSNDNTFSATTSNVNLDFGVDQWIIITTQNVIAADACTLENYYFEITR